LTRTKRQQQADPSQREAAALLTVCEVARRLRVETTTVRRWIATGILDAVVLPHPGKRKCYRILPCLVCAISKETYGTFKRGITLGHLCYLFKKYFLAIQLPASDIKIWQCLVLCFQLWKSFLFLEKFFDSCVDHAVYTGPKIVVHPQLSC
jgi:excisionase family DNA binding protein